MLYLLDWHKTQPRCSGLFLDFYTLNNEIAEGTFISFSLYILCLVFGHKLLEKRSKMKRGESFRPVCEKLV